MESAYGTIVPAPKDYVPRQQWPEYLTEAEEPRWLRPKNIGTHPKGKRWGFFPFLMEEYVSDTEPDLAASDAAGAVPRIIFWHRPSRAEAPKGWRQLSRNPSRVEGFFDLEASPAYFERWDDSARRYRNKWLREYAEVTHRIEEIAFEEFAAAYKKSSVYARAGAVQLGALTALLASEKHRPYVTLFGVRSLATKEVAAGLAIITSPTHASSYYQAGFIVDSARREPHMTGLMDYWCARSKERGIRFLHFGGFWHEGKPRRIWAGFSEFKAKFGVRLVAHQPELVRFRWGRIMA